MVDACEEAAEAINDAGAAGAAGATGPMNDDTFKVTTLKPL